MTIYDLVQLRADGKLIPQGMTVKSMLDLGWSPSKVTALRWTSGAGPVEFMPPRAVVATLVPGEEFVAAILEESAPGELSRLAVLNADGSVRGYLENQLNAGGAVFTGQFGWFEPAMTPGKHMFGVVFQARSGDDLRCDVNAEALTVLRVARTR